MWRCMDKGDMEIVTVDLGERSYPIFIGSGTLNKSGEILERYTNSRTLAVVTNPTVSELYLEEVKNSFEKSGFTVHVIEIPDGEEYKNLTWAGKIYDQLVSFKMDRYSPLVALGGGVIGDITGFVAATYLRGVPFVQIPTTLLAQVDSSVGGKTAVNHSKGKNLIGAFYQPLFVHIDLKTLKTLEPRELKAGMAEVVKYGVISSEQFFSYLEKNTEKLLALDMDVLKVIVKESCKIKAQVVESDEREEGYRAILNFGHTFGHAVEAVTEYKKYRHGETVAIGMLFAARLSHKMGKCSKEIVFRISALLKRLDLPQKVDNGSDRKYLEAMMLDKKVISGKIRFVFPLMIGQVAIEEVEIKDCEAALNI